MPQVSSGAPSRDMIQYLGTDRFHLDDVPELYNRLVEHRRVLRGEVNGRLSDNSG